MGRPASDGQRARVPGKNTGPSRVFPEERSFRRAPRHGPTYGPGLSWGGIHWKEDS